MILSYIVLQFVAVYLQCVVVLLRGHTARAPRQLLSVLQYVAVCCSMLQYVAVRCTCATAVAECDAVRCYVASCGSMLQYVAVCYSTL